MPIVFAVIFLKQKIHIALFVRVRYRGTGTNHLFAEIQSFCFTQNCKTSR